MVKDTQDFDFVATFLSKMEMLCYNGLEPAPSSFREIHMRSTCFEHILRQFTLLTVRVWKNMRK